MTVEPSTFSRTDLTRKTREILEHVRRGHPAMIRSYGEDQAVVLEPLDYRLLRGLAGLAAGTEGREGELEVLLRGYLRHETSLGRVAATLGVSRFDLMERFERLGVPAAIGPETVAEAESEVRAARTPG